MSHKEQMDYWKPIMVVQGAEQAAAYGKEHVVPKRYKDANLIARKKKRNKKRRHWDRP